MIQYKIIAIQYAKAAFEFALEHNNLDLWYNMFKFLTKLINNNCCIKYIIKNIKIESNKKLELLINIYNDFMHNKSDIYHLNFIKIIAKQNRITLLPIIEEQYKILYDSYYKYFSIKLVSAYELSTYEKIEILKSLKKRYNSKNIYIINISINKSLIGGLIIYINNTVIDCSLLSKILKLKYILKGNILCK
ncbi:ATP synthase subunit delta [Candidatus Johnevansia muelleri]|uniref:ATP synthase subunit delta n=1 Tax=Candidatus Johnevansia muelleri TaxID=1495769 RepID=A0A078KHY8_9GAMM|nr:ATP synthase subunit delta [Candidatus Evansia muelleri]